MDFFRDEEEEYGINSKNDQSWQEEERKVEISVSNVTNPSILQPILLEPCNPLYTKYRETPRKQMVPLFKALRLSISFNDHLIKVEGDAQRPTEVPYKEPMYSHPRQEAYRIIFLEALLECHQEEEVSKYNTYTKVHY